MVKLFTCLDCHSFWNPSGYSEDVEQLEKDLQWGFSVEERNKNAAQRLFKVLSDNGVNFQMVVEIGCGIGTVLCEAQKIGKKAIGYDVNNIAIKYAVETNKIEAYSAIWNSNTPTPPVDLYLSLSVLEHIELPRLLIKELCTASKKNNAFLFISVPFLDRDKWKYILNPSPIKEGTPFFDNDVHVTHFSIKGLKKAMKEFGCCNLEVVYSGLWTGILAKPSL